MNTIDFSYINPFSENHHAWDQFHTLKTQDKVAILAVTFFIGLCTLGLGVAPTFRYLVGRVNVVEPAPNPSNNVFKLTYSERLFRPAHVVADEIRQNQWLKFQKKIVEERGAELSQIAKIRSEARAQQQKQKVMEIEKDFSFTSLDQQVAAQQQPHSLTDSEVRIPSHSLVLRDTHLSNFLENTFQKAKNQQIELTEEDALSFDVENSCFCKLKEGENPSESLNAFRELLSSTYGVSLTDLVFERYKVNQANSLTFKMIREVLVGVAANVNVKSLECVFNRIKESTVYNGKQEEIEEEKLLCLMNIDNHVLNCLRRKMEGNPNFSFDDLTSEDTETLLSAFRTVNGNPVADLFIPEEGQAPKIFGGSFNHYAHDLSLLLTMSPRINRDYPNEAISEYLGKQLAYFELKKGLIIPVPEIIGTSTIKTHYFKVYNTLFDTKSAVMSYLLVPMSKNQLGSDAVTPVYQLFRGTRPEGSAIGGGASLLRDVDPTGVGRGAFNDKKEQLKKLWENPSENPEEMGLLNYINAKKMGKIELTIAGHSLGGCDVYRAMAYHLELFHGDERFSKVSGFAHNAPRVEADVNESFSRYLNQAVYPVDLTTVLHFAAGSSDGVHNFGEVRLGKGVEVNHFSNTVYKVSNPNPLDPLSLHSQIGFLSGRPESATLKMDKFRGNDDEVDAPNEVSQYQRLLLQLQHGYVHAGLYYLWIAPLYWTGRRLKTHQGSQDSTRIHGYVPDWIENIKRSKN